MKGQTMSVVQPLVPVAISPHRIPLGTKPTYVHLKVADLGREIAFYRHVLGFELNWQTGDHAGLGVSSRDLVRLSQIPNGRRYRGVTGLYHFAVLFPNRRELARAIARLFALGWPNYPTDHVMTKATYLDDPEGNTIELYCESPEDGVFLLRDGELIAQWADGRPSNGREPLDLQNLFSHLKPEDNLKETVPPETRIGHFHLYVADLMTTRHFYHEQLGFDDMGVAQRFQMGMVSVGGYHHHIGYNTWQGVGAPPPPSDALGLLYIAFTLDASNEYQAFERLIVNQSIPFERCDEGIFLRDPSNNGILFVDPRVPSSVNVF